jgi:hypothetical protein
MDIFLQAFPSLQNLHGGSSAKGGSMVILRLDGHTINADMQLQQIQEAIELEDSYAATARYIGCFRGSLPCANIFWPVIR